MTRRSGLVAFAVVAALGVAAVAWFAARPAGLPTRVPARTVTASIPDVAGAVVNINGRVSDGTVSGTGMIIASDGIVLTNNHVVAGTVGLVAQVAGFGPTYPATVIGVDPTHDVAVIRLEGAAHLPTVPLDTSGVVAAGDHVTGMGNALGHNGSPVSVSGVVTTLDETLGVSGDGGQLNETLNGLIQFTAAIQPGDSGGPLLNEAGRVIGMDTAGSIPNQPASDGGAFGAAIPITTAIGIAHEIIGGVASPYIQSGHTGSLGVDVSDGGGGALVNGVTSGDAADSAGIAAGNVITDVGGSPVRSAADLHAIMQGRRPGDLLTVGWRAAGSATHHATLTLSAGPPA